MPVRSKRRRAWQAAAFAAIVLVAVPAASATAAPDRDPLKLYVPVPEVTVERYGTDQPAEFGEAVSVTAPHKNFEVFVKRNDYDEPIRAELVVDRRHHPLPASLIRGFEGFANAVHLRVTKDNGQLVAEYDSDWCPNGFHTPVDGTASGFGNPTYPFWCDSGPWVKGSVWGVERAWATPLAGFNFFRESTAPVVPDGHYKVTATWNPAIASALGITQGSVKVGVRIKTYDFGEGTAQQRAIAPPEHSAHGLTGPVRREQALVPQVREPRKETVPDLVSAPSSSITTLTQGGKDYLAFGAMVWNAGPAPLVVEGFRQPGKAVMDAYQYFYRNGKTRSGRALVGTMAYDPRPGHQHWHFKDFAQYDLLNNNKERRVRSGKEAFCLANTDSVDITVPYADWLGGYDDLGSVCGGKNATWLRETLSIGYGDTYGQYLPGQSFDITNLPNGTYFIRVTANPMNNLKEVTTANNVSLRKIILGGTPGRRTVNVPPYFGIDTEQGVF